MGTTQLDLLRRQAEAAARNAAAGAVGRLRRDTGLVNQAARLTGRAIRDGGKAAERRWRGKGPAARAPGATVKTAAYVRPASDGYVRRSPVQPVHEAADYRRRLFLRGLGAVAVLAAVCFGIGLLSRLGVFGR